MTKRFFIGDSIIGASQSRRADRPARGKSDIIASPLSNMVLALASKPRDPRPLVGRDLRSGLPVCITCVPVNINVYDTYSDLIIMTMFILFSLCLLI